jgi:hypothetical protein
VHQCERQLPRKHSGFRAGGHDYAGICNVWDSACLASICDSNSAAHIFETSEVGYEHRFALEGHNSTRTAARVMIADWETLWQIDLRLPRNLNLENNIRQGYPSPQRVLPCQIQTWSVCLCQKFVILPSRLREVIRQPVSISFELPSPLESKETTHIGCLARCWLSLFTQCTMIRSLLRGIACLVVVNALRIGVNMHVEWVL